jgi:hypothetical protein
VTIITNNRFQYGRCICLRPQGLQQRTSTKKWCLLFPVYSVDDVQRQSIQDKNNMSLQGKKPVNIPNEPPHPETATNANENDLSQSIIPPFITTE